MEKESSEIKCQTIMFEHEQKDVFFNFWEESDGTIRLLDLLEILIDNNRTFIVDEFETCLHPNLTYEFIRLFLEKASNRNTQLIITTHEEALLDLNLIRRDEVQFIQKQKNGSTIVLPLENKKVRFDKNIAKAYLNGVYDGIPTFSN